MKNKRALKIGAGLAGLVLAGVVAVESLAPGMIDKKLKSQENLDRARPFVKIRLHYICQMQLIKLSATQLLKK